MGIILGLLQALFPRTTVLMIEGIVIQDVERPKIYCDINSSAGHESTKITIETRLRTSDPIFLPIIWLETRLELSFGTCRFSWTGCIADWLRLNFRNVGLTCDQTILDACCNLVVLLPTVYSIEPRHQLPKVGLSFTPLLSLLGPLPRARMHDICENIWQSTPSVEAIDLIVQSTDLRLLSTLQLKDWAASALQNSNSTGANGVPRVIR